MPSPNSVIIMGAGPAGLTAAYELCKAGIGSLILEKDDIVGGLARTLSYRGYLFDIGGHRFFTKSKVVEKIWREVLGEDFLERKRLSRIYYNKKFFYYPLKPWNALFGLGVWSSIRVFFSYLKSHLFPIKNEKTFEEWVSNRFGKRLYEIFFKTYTEKVWGIPCHKISAEWAAQRIKGLSLFTAIKNAVKSGRAQRDGSVIKTLIDRFNYPKLGPGMMWEKMAESIQKSGSKICLKSSVEKICWAEGRVTSVEAVVNGKRESMAADHFISSIPLRHLIERLEPRAPEKVLASARKLRYRDFLTVVLIIDKEDVFPDNWIYIHDPNVKVGRIQNFKNWSPYMVPDSKKTCLGLEYFCSQDDSFWAMSDDQLVELGKKELDHLGLSRGMTVIDGTAIRMPKAYPVYDDQYKEALSVIREFLVKFSNLQPIGRNGTHKYNNQDHSMLMALMAVRNILGGHYDLWEINSDQEYHEELREISSTEPHVPQGIPLAVSTNTAVSE